MDVSMLPKVMQVKNFGKRSRTKYTHLLDQDTTATTGGFGGSAPVKVGGMGLEGGGCFLCGGPHLKKGDFYFSLVKYSLISCSSKIAHKTTIMATSMLYIPQIRETGMVTNGGTGWVVITRIEVVGRPETADIGRMMKMDLLNLQHVT